MTDIQIKDPQFSFNNPIMDVVFNNVLQDLNKFQSKIASLFQDLIKEKVYYRENLDHLYKNLKEASTETEKLKTEIKILREDNLNMRSVILKGIHLFKSLDLSKTIKPHTNELEALKAVFLEYSTRMENSNLTENISSKETKEICKKRCEMTDEEIQKEIESLKSMHYCSNLFDDAVTNKNTGNKHPLQRSCSEETFKSCVLVRNNEDIVQTAKETKLIQRTNSFDPDYVPSTISSEPVEPVELLSQDNKSPVFKDFNNQRNYSNMNSVEGSGDSGLESWNSSLVSEKILEKVINSDLSSPEKSPQTDKISPSSRSPAQKWVCNSFKIHSKYRTPPSNILKKSYSREVEKSSSGMRILTQTVLNVQRFRKSTPEKSKRFQNEENENQEWQSNTSEEDVYDIPIEVPKKADNVLKDVNNKQTSGHELEEIAIMTPPLMTEPDLDETYISTPIIRKHMLEGGTEDRTPLKRHALERRTAEDFPYKDKPVRKKAERMNLPGHACAQCNKYYKNALGDIGAEELKKILNKCSRHRQRYSPSLDDTPPDYWKPYLTSSTIVSPDSRRDC